MITTLDAYLKNHKTQKTEENTYKYYEQPHEENPKKEECQENGWAYESTKNIAKMIRKDLKKEFGNTIKFSVRSEAYPRSIRVEIKEISKKHIMAYGSFKEYMMCSYLFNEENYDMYLRAYDTGNFKKYHVCEETYEKIGLIINKYNYDNSDPYTDYFDVNYYDSWEMGDNLVVLD